MLDKTSEEFLFPDIKRTLQWIHCHTIQMLLCTMWFWEDLIEKWLSGIIGIQKSQNIFMLGSKTYPMCSIHWLGKIRRKSGWGNRVNNWETRVCTRLWRDLLAGSPGGSRWSITKRGVVSALGFLWADSNNSCSSRSVSFPWLQAELGENSLEHVVTLPGEVGGGTLLPFAWCWRTSAAGTAVWPKARRRHWSSEAGI